jgi:hypothetical protein
LTGQRINEQWDRGSAFVAVDKNVIAEAKLARPWLNPLSLLVLREAVTNRETTVVLEGKEYTVTYEQNDKVWLQYTRGPAPCGRFPIADIMTPGKIF